MVYLEQHSNCRLDGDGRGGGGDNPALASLLKTDYVTVGLLPEPIRMLLRTKTKQWAWLTIDPAFD